MAISPLTCWIAALSVGGAALSYGYFYNYAPMKAEEAAWIKNKEELESVISKKGQADNRVQKVAEQIVVRLGEWRDIVAVQTPGEGAANGGIDLSVNPWQLVINARSYRNRIQAQMNEQVKVGGVDVINGPVVPAFSQSATNIVESNFNYPAKPYPMLMLNLGQVSVRGTFEQISANFNAWNKIKRYLAVCDGLQFSGTSPNLSATYNVYLLGYIRGDKIGATVPEGGAPAGGGAPAAGGFRPPTGPIGAPSVGGGGGGGKQQGQGGPARQGAPAAG